MAGPRFWIDEDDRLKRGKGRQYSENSSQSQADGVKVLFFAKSGIEESFNQHSIDWASNDRLKIKAAILNALKHDNNLWKIYDRTGDAILIEMSGKDEPYWGNGEDGRGKNELGLLLMEVRNELRNEFKKELKEEKKPTLQKQSALRTEAPKVTPEKISINKVSRFPAYDAFFIGLKSVIGAGLLDDVGGYFFYEFLNELTIKNNKGVSWSEFKNYIITTPANELQNVLSEQFRVFNLNRIKNDKTHFFNNYIKQYLHKEFLQYIEHRENGHESKDFQPVYFGKFVPDCNRRFENLYNYIQKNKSTRSEEAINTWFDTSKDTRNGFFENLIDSDIVDVRELSAASAFWQVNVAVGTPDVKPIPMRKLVFYADDKSQDLLDKSIQLGIVKKEGDHYVWTKDFESEEALRDYLKGAPVSKGGVLDQKKEGYFLSMHVTTTKGYNNRLQEIEHVVENEGLTKFLLSRNIIRLGDHGQYFYNPIDVDVAYRHIVGLSDSQDDISRVVQWWHKENANRAKIITIHEKEGEYTVETNVPPPVAPKAASKVPTSTSTTTITPTPAITPKSATASHVSPILPKIPDKEIKAVVAVSPSYKNIKAERRPAKGDGNCGFNSFAGGLALIAPNGSLDADGNNGRYDEFLKHLVTDKIIKGNTASQRWGAFKIYLEESQKSQTSYEEMQVKLAPHLRDLAIQQIKDDKTSPHKNATLVILQAGFEYFCKGLYPSPRKFVSYEDILAFDFINDKFGEFKKELTQAIEQQAKKNIDGKITDEQFEALMQKHKHGLETWWNKDGHDKFLEALKKPSNWVGETELQPLAKYFNVPLEVAARGTKTPIQVHTALKFSANAAAILLNLNIIEYFDAKNHDAKFGYIWKKDIDNKQIELLIKKQYQYTDPEERTFIIETFTPFLVKNQSHSIQGVPLGDLASIIPQKFLDFLVESHIISNDPKLGYIFVVDTVETIHGFIGIDDKIIKEAIDQWELTQKKTMVLINDSGSHWDTLDYTSSASVELKAPATPTPTRVQPTLPTTARSSKFTSSAAGSTTSATPAVGSAPSSTPSTPPAPTTTLSGKEKKINASSMTDEEVKRNLDKDKAKDVETKLAVTPPPLSPAVSPTTGKPAARVPLTPEAKELHKEGIRTYSDIVRSLIKSGTPEERQKLRATLEETRAKDNKDTKRQEMLADADISLPKPNQYKASRGVSETGKPQDGPAPTLTSTAPGTYELKPGDVREFTVKNGPAKDSKYTSQINNNRFTTVVKHIPEDVKKDPTVKQDGLELPSDKIFDLVDKSLLNQILGTGNSEKQKVHIQINTASEFNQRSIEALILLCIVHGLEYQNDTEHLWKPFGGTGVPSPEAIDYTRKKISTLTTMNTTKEYQDAITKHTAEEKSIIEDKIAKLRDNAKSKNNPGNFIEKINELERFYQNGVKVDGHIDTDKMKQLFDDLYEGLEEKPEPTSLTPKI